METGSILSVAPEWISCLSSLGNSLGPSAEHHRGLASGLSFHDVLAAAQLGPLWSAPPAL